MFECLCEHLEHLYFFANILPEIFLFDFPLNGIHIVSNLPWCRFFEVPTRKRYNTCLENSSQQIFQRFLELAEQWRDTCSEILCQQQILGERISKVIQKQSSFMDWVPSRWNWIYLIWKRFHHNIASKAASLQYHNFERSVILHFLCKYMIALLNSYEWKGCPQPNKSEIQRWKWGTNSKLKWLTAALKSKTE